MADQDQDARALVEAAAQKAGLGAMLVQLGPLMKRVIDRLKPVIDQPIIRFPYNLPLANTQTIGAGVTGFRLPQADFSHSLEWPFEVNTVKFSQDPAHGFRDWRVMIEDQTFNQPMMKNAAMVADLVADNTGQWALPFPWTIRPKGGAMIVSCDNLDTVAPLQVDINFQGFLLIPRA